MTPPTGRTEKRIRFVMAVRLWEMEQPEIANQATTENVSAHGARIVTTRALRPSEQLFVTLSGMLFQLEARVVYCRSVAEGVFQAGLCFTENVWNSWPPMPERHNS